MRKLIGAFAALATPAALAFAVGGTAQAEEQANQTHAVQANLAAGGTVNNCPYLYLCTYTGKNFTGSRHLMSKCQRYDLPYYFQSWVNNQTPGTEAVFRDSEGQVLYTTPPALTRDGDSTVGPPLGTDLGAVANFVTPC